MREAKTKELREAAVVMAQTHSSQMDRKNALLRALELEVDDAETQRRRAAASHVAKIDALITLHTRRARESSDAFATEARAIADAFASEEAEIKEKHARHRRDMLDVLEAMEKAHETSFADRRARFETAREEIKSRNAEAFENAKARLEASVRACERMCEEAHKAYVSGTDTRAASFEQLTARDSQSARVIESRMRDLGRLAKKVRAARGALESQSREWKAKNKALRKEKERVRDHGLTLAATTKKFRAEAESRLKALLRDSNGALKALDAKLTDADRILRLAAAARRLETERERVVPFGEEDEEGSYSGEARDAEALTNAMLTDAARAEAEDRAGKPLARVSEEELLSTAALDSRGSAVDETRYLERFFRRFNKAYLDALASGRERERLSAENADLRDIVAGYLNGVTVSDETMRDADNPLFVVNERALKAQAERRDAESRAEAARAAEGDKKERAARKLYNSRGGGGSGGEREGSAAVSAPVEVFVDAN